MENRVAIEVKKYFKVADSTISLAGGSKKWHCLFCTKTITGSAPKLRANLRGVRGFNVAACDEVSEDTQSAISVPHTAAIGAAIHCLYVMEWLQGPGPALKSRTCGTSGPGPRSGSGQVPGPCNTGA